MKIIFDDEMYDRTVHEALPDCGEELLAFVVKDNVTKQGNPGVCITFASMTDNGPKRVQIVVTVRNLLTVLSALAGRYEYLLERKWAPKDTPKTLSGHVDGIGWNAIFMEQMYFINVENGAVGIAATEEDVTVTAAGLIRTGGG